MIAGVRTYLELAAAAVLLTALWWFGFHERGVGEQVIEKADSRATEAVTQETDAETIANAVKGAIAAQGASNAQKSVDAYLAAHPVLDDIGVCNSNHRSSGVPKTAANGSRTQNTPTGPVAVRAVPDGSDSADISPALTVIMQTVGRLAVIDNERYQLQVTP